MITQITIRNFKSIKEAAIGFSDHLVFVGPNNSGKTTAIQALAVWRLALSKWLEKRTKAGSKAKERPGVPLTRSDFTVLPLRDMRQLWFDCLVQDSNNKKIRAEILVEGVQGAASWSCGMELEFQGAEQIYCRPMRVTPDSKDRMPVPKQAEGIQIGHLPPLAGLQPSEDKVNDRSLRTRISEGRAGDVLRNLLLNVADKSSENWAALSRHVSDMFQIELLPPQYLNTGEIMVEYYKGLRTEGKKTNPHPKLDLSTAGSGLHQFLLLMAFLFDQAGSVLLFDEPDAHLEIIRQRDIYALLRKVAQERKAQLIVATHSEEIMDNTDHPNLIAFLGGPPRVLASEHEVKQLRKALVRIPSQDYLKAKERGGVLYVEDYTDVDLLRAWARQMEHPAFEFLKSPFFVPVGNVASHARDHYYGLRAAYPNLKGVLLLDQDATLNEGGDLLETQWKRREIENYLLVPDAMVRFCQSEITPPVDETSTDKQTLMLPGIIPNRDEILALLRKRMLEEDFANPYKDTPFLIGTKASEVILEPFFKDFYALVGQYNNMRKNSFYRLAAIMEKNEIHLEVVEKLDRVAQLLPEKSS